MENQDNCPICNVKASQFCSACKSVKYCGAEHQKQHWKIHKNECRPFCISKDENVGRFLLATRDIKLGTVIFNESPLIVGPKWNMTDKEISTPIVPCVGCYSPVNIVGNSCSKCNWPACSENCSGLNNPKLHGLECAILRLGLSKQKNIGTDLKSLMDYYRIDAIVVLKCLMLQKIFPKKWEQLLDMQSHEDERTNSELYMDAEKRIVSYLMENFLEPLKSYENEIKQKILNINDIKILRKICGIIETNYMLINLPNGLDLTGLFYTACMMEHSCLPNCYFVFDYHNGFKVSVIAGKNIEKGEHLKIMYTNILWGTLLRQEHLQITKHFTCNCNRCIDPSELNTNFSGLKCMGIDPILCNWDGGIQLPEDPLNQDSDWKCDKCPVKISGKEIRYLLQQMGDEVELLLSKKPTIQKIEKLVEKLKQFLHDNHYHLFNLKHCLIQLYGIQKDDENELKHKNQLCNELIDICNKLDPYAIRISIHYAVILTEKFNAILKLNEKYLKDNNDREKSQTAIENIKIARKNLLFKAKDILKKELDTNIGFNMNKAIDKSISNADELITNWENKNCA